MYKNTIMSLNTSKIKKKKKKKKKKTSLAMETHGWIVGSLAIETLAVGLLA
jgi:hypothetical protein